jgi:serine/threonine protein kinase
VLPNPERELKALRSLCGPKNIITILRYGNIDGGIGDYVDMELCDGTLRQYIAGSDPFRPQNKDPMSMSPDAVQRRIENAWEIMSHIVAGVQHIHSQDFVHRLLCPSNVHFRSRDGTWIVSNIEGACYGPDGIESSEGIGVVGYRAPELLAVEPVPYTNKVDIWALGCILFALVMGRDAFSDDIATLVLDLPSVIVAGIDSESQQKLSAASNIMLVLSPGQRASARDLCDLFRSK